MSWQRVNGNWIFFIWSEFYYWCIVLFASCATKYVMYRLCEVSTCLKQAEKGQTLSITFASMTAKLVPFGIMAIYYLCSTFRPHVLQWVTEDEDRSRFWGHALLNVECYIMLALLGLVPFDWRLIWNKNYYNLTPKFFFNFLCPFKQKIIRQNIINS